MKKAFSILLIMLIISQTMVNVGIGVYYHLNKDYIVRKLCINKNNPAMHCNGRCYLSKQLKRAEQREKQSTQLFKERNEFFSNDNFDISVSYFPAYSISVFRQYNIGQPPADSYNFLIKPPAC